MSENNVRGAVMPIGLLKWFDAKKGFGFIADEQGQDVFVHYTVIEGDGFRCLRYGEKVEYECDRGPKGLHATKVRRCLEGASGERGKRVLQDVKG
jgi:cold shock protein